MKLYATTKTSRGKKEGIGDNVSINTTLSKGNQDEFLVYYSTEFLHVYKIVNEQGGGVLVYDSSKGKKQKTANNDWECSCGLSGTKTQVENHKCRYNQ